MRHCKICGRFLSADDFDLCVNCELDEDEDEDDDLEVCEVCGELIDSPDMRADREDMVVCTDCNEEMAPFEGDYSEWHPDETEEEFFDHEDKC